ncbi:MAG: flagellar basal body P-ring formation protein FlgA [Armatimonadetes bacterium]|nr:flagellar basal body P-ring formation protein FlgA [Armatimonadota bacterium]
MRLLFVCSLLALLWLKAAQAAAPPEASTPAAPTPQTVITFHAQAEVEGDRVRLGDVALIETEDAGLAERLAAVVVGAAPLVGRTRSLSAAYCKIRVRANRVDLKSLAFAGADLVEVLRKGQVVRGADVLAAAVAELERQRPESGAVFVPASQPSDITVPLGEVALEARCRVGASGSSAAVPVSISVSGRPVALQTVYLRVGRRAPALILARDLPAGAELTPEDVVVEERTVLPGPVALSAVEDIAGCQLAQPTKAGTTLTRSLVRAVVLVKRGAHVRLVCRAPGFVVSCLGEALGDATRGQTVRVRNPTSQQELAGVVVDRDLVEVSF